MIINGNFYRCTTCNQILTSRLKVKYHTKWLHRIDIVKLNIFICPFCLKELIIPPGFNKDLIFCPYCKQSIILGEKDVKETIVETING